jgi:hypothetical protein
MHQLIAQANVVKPGFTLFGFNLKIVYRPRIFLCFWLIVLPTGAAFAFGRLVPFVPEHALDQNSTL